MKQNHLAIAACLLLAAAVGGGLWLAPDEFTAPAGEPGTEDPFAAYVAAECEARQIAAPAQIASERGQMLHTWRDTDGILRTLRFVDDPNGDFRTVEGSGTVPVDETFSYEFVPEAEGGGTALVLYLEPNGGTTLGTWQVVGTLADGTATGFFLAEERLNVQGYERLVYPIPDGLPPEVTVTVHSSGGEEFFRFAAKAEA